MPEENISKYISVPQPSEITQREKEDAMGSYLMMFAAFAVGLPLPILNLIAAFIYYVLNNKKSRFVKFHCLQSMLSQIPTTIMNAVLVYWTIRLFFFGVKNDYDVSNSFIENQMYIGYLITVIVANLIYVIFSIVGAVYANKGRFYYFIFFGKLSFHYSYKAGEEENKPENKAPF